VVARAWLSTQEKRGHQSGHHLNVARFEYFKIGREGERKRERGRGRENREQRKPIKFSTSVNESYFYKANIQRMKKRKYILSSVLSY